MAKKIQNTLIIHRFFLGQHTSKQRVGGLWSDGMCLYDDGYPIAVRLVDGSVAFTRSGPSFYREMGKHHWRWKWAKREARNWYKPLVVREIKAMALVVQEKDIYTNDKTPVFREVMFLDRPGGKPVEQIYFIKSDGWRWREIKPEEDEHLTYALIVKEVGGV